MLSFGVVFAALGSGGNTEGVEVVSNDTEVVEQPEVVESSQSVAVVVPESNESETLDSEPVVIENVSVNFDIGKVVTDTNFASIEYFYDGEIMFKYYPAGGDASYKFTTSESPIKLGSDYKYKVSDKVKTYKYQFLDPIFGDILYSGSFDMVNYVAPKPVPKVDCKSLKEKSCLGTSACVTGYKEVTSWYKSVRKTYEGCYDRTDCTSMGRGACEAISYCKPIYNEKKAWKGVKKIFSSCQQMRGSAIEIEEVVEERPVRDGN